MTFRPIFLVLATLTLSPAFAAPPPAQVTAWTPPGATTCSFSGWTNDEKPVVQVRAAPSSQAKVLGTLPTTRGEGPDPTIDYYSVTFDVAEARDGWLRIKNASDAKTGNDQSRPRPVYQGEGWIEAGDANIAIQSARGYARPDPASQRLLDLQDNWLTERAKVQGIVACDGQWLLLDYEIRNSDKFEALPPKDRTRGRAWFRGICEISETTCDMPSVDK
ncbi:SH3 domain-containing protein [Achromobacter sp. DH1f]|uniref:SH3 domain-containing protein n=1 Tax=Achromobacter sp. DH1f TaxID=1397275 RepID=UPI000467F555|nr:SH3 domain-containing protein [Achromobacter sp. DH1f]